MGVNIHIEYIRSVGVILTAVLEPRDYRDRIIALFLLDKIDAKSERNSHQGLSLDRDPGSSSSRDRFVLFTF